MNQMQEMLMRAQKMQRELAKAQAALAETEFTVSKAGIVEVILKGDKTIKSITLDKDAIDPENKEMIEETIVMAVNEGLDKIAKEEEKTQEKITGVRGGMPF